MLSYLHLTWVLTKFLQWISRIFLPFNYSLKDFKFYWVCNKIKICLKTFTYLYYWRVPNQHVRIQIWIFLWGLFCITVKYHIWKRIITVIITFQLLRNIAVIAISSFNHWNFAMYFNFLYCNKYFSKPTAALWVKKETVCDA